jgi:hypothetical protein
MALATGLTIVYHRLLCKAFNPLLSFFPTALKDALAKDATSTPIFIHKAFKSTPAIRIPKDDHGIGSTRALQLREELPSVTVSDLDATITESGKIQLR